MQAGKIIEWIKLGLLILQYGREAVILAIEIYKKVEEAFRDSKKQKASKSAEKAFTWETLFRKEIEQNKKLKTKKKQELLAEAPKIREQVWAILSSKNVPQKKNSVAKVTTSRKVG